MITSNSFTSSIKEIVLVSDHNLSASEASSLGNVLDKLSQQDKANIFSNTDYSAAPNAVKLLNPITNNNGKIKVYTEINSNLRVGDRVFFIYDSNDFSLPVDGYILDNYLEFSGCSNFQYLEQMQGYDVIEINEDNNEITIDRFFDLRLQNKKLYNHYLSKIYISNITINGGEIDGACIKKASFNTESDSLLDINLVQAIVFSGVSYYIRYKDKYDNLYISTNSVVNTENTASTYKPYLYKGVESQNQDPTPASSYFTNNNENYGYTYVFRNSFANCRIDNGYYINCNLTNCLINGGSFVNCNLTGATINGGYFSNSFIDTTSYWFGGIWSGGTFNMNVWYDGIWNGGDFCGKQWRNGIFNGGYFSGSTWKDGIFQDGIIENSTWSGGTFTYGLMNNTDWFGGIFNGGQISNGNWFNGICNGGTITNVQWSDGVFNGGTFNNGYWTNGTVNNGNILNSTWVTGTFNGGTFNSGNNVPLIQNNDLYKLNNPIYNSGRSWLDGDFNGGIFSNSIWIQGTFRGGLFQNGSLWSGGTFKDGEFDNSTWINGYFGNGKVTRSNFHNVQWYNGIWNSGNLGIGINFDGITLTHPTVYWSGGTFNGGTFGYDSDNTIAWLGGHFYGGTFINKIPDCNDLSPIDLQQRMLLGGFFIGTFHNGIFRGTFWKGTWVSGTFDGCNRAGIVFDTIKKDTIIFRTATGGLRRYGEQSISMPQNGIRNTN